MNSSPTPSSMPSQTATRGMFSFAWFDMTPILRSYLCATTASGYPPTLTSVWVKDWECGSSPRLQSNWARTSPETPKSMEMSSSFWSRVNQFVKVEFRQPLRSRGFIAICRTSVGDSTSYAKRGTAVQADVRFGSLADITTRCVMSALPTIADIRRCRWDVRYVPTADGYPTSSRRIRGTIHDL